MHPDLSFEQAPPVSVPFRFFVTAPWFGVLAGVLLVWSGDAAFASRWTPDALALTHLLTAGFMLQAMSGALFQFVPVAAGGNVWNPRVVAWFVHSTMLLGACFLVAAFWAHGWFFRPAIAFLGLGVSVFVAVVGRAIWNTPAQGPTIAALRLAVPALGVTALLGAFLAEGLGAAHGWPILEIADVHAVWGLGAWALTLLMGVSYYVVPMFQLTPPYPRRFAFAMPALLGSAIVLWSFRSFGDVAYADLARIGGLGIAAVFGAKTLHLQRQRRRRVRDSTLLFFRCAMGSLVMLFLSELAFLAIPSSREAAGGPIWIGLLSIVGVFVSAISGMLYKIVPFVSWLHLQKVYAPAPAPNMREIIPDRAIRLQMRAHFASFGVLLAAVWWPEFTRVAGALFALSCGWLGWNVIRGAQAYRRFKDRMHPTAGRS